MKHLPIAQEGLTVVLRGSFSPPQFSPQWFFDCGLVGQSELDAADIEVISREYAYFSLDWLLVVVTQDSLQLATLDPDEFERVKDALVGVMHSAGPRPVSALGINRDYHVTLESTDQVNTIGDALAPKAVWGDTLEQAAMRTLVIWGVRPDLFSGRIQVTVEPSNVFPNSVFISTNDHYSLSRVEQQQDSRHGSWDLDPEAAEASLQKHAVAFEVLASEWRHALDRAEAARKNVISLAGDFS